MKALEGRNLSFRYPGGPLLLQKANLYVKPGESVILKGPSGSGKTTLCHLLSGIIPRSLDGEVAGEILLFEKELPQLSLGEVVQKVGVLFQNPDAQLFFPTVEDEIAFGPENLCLPRAEVARRVDRALEAVQMSAYRAAETETLSRGQKQLIAFAAVLSLEPKILILDEVFAQLDTASTLLVREIIQAQKEQGRAILLVENNAQNWDLAQRLYELKGRRLQEVSL